MAAREETLESYTIDPDKESAIVISDEGEAKVLQREHQPGEAASDGALIINAVAWKMQQADFVNKTVKEFMEAVNEKAPDAVIPTKKE